MEIIYPNDAPIPADTVFVVTWVEDFDPVCEVYKTLDGVAVKYPKLARQYSERHRNIIADMEADPSLLAVQIGD